MLPSISIEPASLVLAPVRVGTTFSAAVTIRNEVAQNLIVGQIGGADPVGAPWSISDDTCSSAVMVQDSFCTFRLDFTPYI